MRTLAKILLSMTVIVIVLIWASMTFLPWKGFVANKAQSFMEANGFHGINFTISDLGFRKMTLKDITSDNVSLKTLAIHYSLMDFLKEKQPELNASILSLTGHSDDPEVKVSVAGGDIYVKMNQPDHWEGNWQLYDVQTNFGEFALPALEGKGTLKTGTNIFSLSGQFKSRDNTCKADFNFDTHSNNLKLIHATFPWKGGTLTVKNVLIPLKGKQPVKPVLLVQQVSIGEIMQILTGKRVSATGSVSGNLPLVIERDGSITFGKGKLQSNGSGIITMPSDVIPGDNAQVAITRDILKNFHYGSLSISISKDGESEVPVLVTLEGNNPDMYNGKPVKINIRLSGDVLNFIRQNVMFLTDPKSILKQGRQ